MTVLDASAQRAIVRRLDDQAGALNVTIPYTPHDAKGKGGQAEFHGDRYRYAYRAVFSGTGGGKTKCGVFEELMWGLENPSSQLGVWEPTFPMVRTILWPAWKTFIGGFKSSPLVSHWSKTEKRLELVNEATYFFGSMEEPESNEGPNLDAAHLDEARLVPRLAGEDGALSVITRRLRGSKPRMRIGFWVTTSAPNKVLHLFFENARTRMPGSKVYRWSSLDNPYLPDSYETIIARYTGSSKERMVEGRYALAEGRVYSEFDPAVHVKKGPDPKIVTRKSVGIDWGFTHPASVMFIQWTGSKAHVRSEWVHAGKGDEDIRDELHRLRLEHGAFHVYAGADRPEGIEYLKKAYVKDGQQHPGFVVEKYVGKVEDRIDRINSMFKARELTVDPSCQALQEELEVHARKPNGDPEDEGQDACDGMAYGVVGGGKKRQRSWIWE